MNSLDNFDATLFLNISSPFQCGNNTKTKIALNKAPENCDKIKMVNRLLDGIVFALLLVKIMDFLSVETGFALTSIAAVRTTGWLIVSLASQEIAKGILSGVEMASSDRFYEGDEVHFGDG